MPGQNGNDGNTNILDIKTSPPGTPQSNPSSSSTGGGGQSTGCGQSGGNTGGVCGGNKMMAIRVQMLDDSITLFQVQVKYTLFSLIKLFAQLNILTPTPKLFWWIKSFSISVKGIGKDIVRASLQAA